MQKPFRIIILFIFLLLPFISSAQMVQPDKKWEHSVEKKGNDTWLVIKGHMNAGWHLYSQFTPVGGPLPTTLTFAPSKNYKLSGQAKESATKTMYDSTFEVNVLMFEHEPEFRQKIEVLTDKKFTVKAVVDGQACNDQTCVLINPVNLTFTINADAKNTTAVEEDTTSEVVPTETPADTATVIATPPPAQLNADCGDWSSGEFVADKSYWGIFIAGFIGGLLALLTPCVFPMIPMTVSFFTKRSGSRKKDYRMQLSMHFPSSLYMLHLDF